MNDDLKEIEQPNTLEEAFTYLDKSLQDKSLFKDTLEANVLGMTHFSMGIWMRNNWHLWWHYNYNVGCFCCGLCNKTIISFEEINLWQINLHLGGG